MAVLLPQNKYPEKYDKDPIGDLIRLGRIRKMRDLGLCLLRRM